MKIQTKVTTVWLAVLHLCQRNNVRAKTLTHLIHSNKESTRTHTDALKTHHANYLNENISTLDIPVSDAGFSLRAENAGM